MDVEDVALDSEEDELKNVGSPLISSPVLKKRSFHVELKKLSLKFQSALILACSLISLTMIT
mgnify:CR=1 FL=1